MSFSPLSFAPVQGKRCRLMARLPAPGCDLRVSPAWKSAGTESSPPGRGNRGTSTPWHPNRPQSRRGVKVGRSPNSPCPAGVRLSPGHRRDPPVPGQAAGAAGEPALPLPELAGPAGLSAQPHHLFAKLPSLCSTREENGPYREAICSLTKPFRLSAAEPTPAAARASSPLAPGSLKQSAARAATRKLVALVNGSGEGAGLP